MVTRSPEQQQSIDNVSQLAKSNKQLDTHEVKELLRDLQRNSVSYSWEMLKRAIQAAIDLKDSPELVAKAFLGFAKKVQESRQAALNKALEELVAELDIGKNTTQA
jgi:transposase